MELTDNEKEHYQERAGIIEFMANVPRDIAERLAMEEIRRKVDSDKAVQR